MDLMVYGSLAVIGLIGGTMAGFLGIGGGIVIIPLLLYVAGLEVKLAMGISMIQALFATLSGLLIHRRNRTVDVRLGVILGIAGVMGALIGSFGSAYISADILLITYFCLVWLSIFLLFVAPKNESPRDKDVSIPQAFPLGLGVGTLAGMLGVGGGFIMTPLMISVLRIPTRTAVG
ncbi:MAG: sulfite exporter TauE/SafE family protein, partial [Chloroflexota bacterium]